MEPLLYGGAQLQPYLEDLTWLDNPVTRDADPEKVHERTEQMAPEMMGIMEGRKGREEVGTGWGGVLERSDESGVPQLKRRCGPSAA